MIQKFLLSPRHFFLKAFIAAVFCHLLCLSLFSVRLPPARPIPTSLLFLGSILDTYDVTISKESLTPHVTIDSAINLPLESAQRNSFEKKSIIKKPPFFYSQSLGFKKPFKNMISITPIREPITPVTITGGTSVPPRLPLGLDNNDPH